MTGNERKQPEGNQFCHQDQSQKNLVFFRILEVSLRVRVDAR